MNIKNITLCSLTPAAFSRESCKKAINWFEENIDHARPGGYGDENDSNALDNLELSIRPDFFNLSPAIGKGLANFKKKYELVEKNISPYTLDINDILMCKWSPNNYYNNIHCERGTGNTDRVLSWMFYLNDIKHGGGTEFIYQNITTIPKAGDFIIFPSGVSHMHRGENAPHETKYIITGHFIYVDTRKK